MNITILNLTVGDEKTNRLLAFLDGEEIHWTTQPVLPQAHVSSSGDNNCYEDDEEDEELDGHWECEFCGGEDGKHIGYDCPNDDSPYALLLRRGYD